MRSSADVLASAEYLADELLFPSATRVDVSGRIPPGHLDRLADAGFYGLAGPDGWGGPTADATTLARVVEVLAGGCLATAFVWLQHHGAVRAVANAPDLVPGEWLLPLCRGDRRAGVVLAALRPGPASVRATPVPGGYRLDGAAPWVTGWGLVDVLLVAARDADDTVIWLRVDAAEGRTLRAEPLDLVAAQASRTVHIGFDGHIVPAGRVAGRMPYAEWPPRDAAGLRLNGSLALGVAGRCCRLLGDDAPLGKALAAVRAALDAAGPAELPAARAAASAFALRVAATLTATAGARGILRAEHAQRLAREALFLLVFGSRPGIRAALLPMLRGD